MSHGTEAILNLMGELGENASELLMQELIRYLSSDDLIQFVHHFRTMHDMIDADPEEEESESYEEDNTEDMPSEPRAVLYPGHTPGYSSNDPINW